MRWWLAKVICLRGLAGVMDFPGVLEAARFEYPGHFMSSAAAIYAGTCIEVLAGVLLAIGFMTRYAALALLLISIGIQFAYAPFDSQLFWIAMFTRFAIYGAGPMSLDNLLRRGLSESALLLIPRIVRGLVHVGFLFGVRNPIATVMNRFWAYLRFGGGMTERPSKLALARSRCIGQPNR
jgi:NADH dehydrogenase/putative oxidoreductase